MEEGNEEPVERASACASNIVISRFTMAPRQPTASHNSWMASWNE